MKRCCEKFQYEVQGTTDVVQEITREAAAAMMEPPVSSRQLQLYISTAALFLKEFEQFIDPYTGGINRKVKLNHCHIPILKRIRARVWSHGFLYTETDLKNHPRRYRTGEL
ncbi:MAG: hypothetical protein PUP93_26540 [Rhizonema sp. NSF051]|nr:hypothetical protein [Rhizonema sp. NSF051]